jgi:hypothetical protein
MEIPYMFYECVYICLRMSADTFPNLLWDFCFLFRLFLSVLVDPRLSGTCSCIKHTLSVGHGCGHTVVDCHLVLHLHYLPRIQRYVQLNCLCSFPPFLFSLSPLHLTHTFIPALPFLKRTEVFLYPILLVLLGYVVAVVTQTNISLYVFRYYGFHDSAPSLETPLSTTVSDLILSNTSTSLPQ